MNKTRHVMKLVVVVASFSLRSLFVRRLKPAATMCLCAFVPLCLPFRVWAAGESVVESLTLGVGARASSMGEACSALADDVNTLYWNPAGLTQVSGRSATFMHAAHIANSYYDWMAFTQKIGENTGYGIGVQYMAPGKITATDVTGTETGSFTPTDMTVMFGFGYQFNGFSLGITGKYIQSEIINSAETGAMDVGILTPMYLNNKMRMALTVTNAGGKIKYNKESEKLPLAVRGGWNYKIRDEWMTEVDFVKPKDNRLYAGLGTEYIWWVNERLGLAGRAGYNSRTMGDIDGVTGISLGLGFILNKFEIDYGFLPFGFVGTSHRVSVSVDFD